MYSQYKRNYQTKTGVNMKNNRKIDFATVTNSKIF